MSPVGDCFRRIVTEELPRTCSAAATWWSRLLRRRRSLPCPTRSRSTLQTTTPPNQPAGRTAHAPRTTRQPLPRRPLPRRPLVRPPARRATLPLALTTPPPAAPLADSPPARRPGLCRRGRPPRRTVGVGSSQHHRLAVPRHRQQDLPLPSRQQDLPLPSCRPHRRLVPRAPTRVPAQVPQAQPDHTR
jgi:hypothetical protein